MSAAEGANPCPYPVTRFPYLCASFTSTWLALTSYRPRHFCPAVKYVPDKWDNPKDVERLHRHRGATSRNGGVSAGWKEVAAGPG
jgi:hypothetical protein